MTQDEILRACNHGEYRQSEVKMGRGEIRYVCSDCWNASVAARRANRKVQLADQWAKYRETQAQTMREAGAEIGQRVSYFCTSFFNLGGETYYGTIAANRNGVAIVKFDRPSMTSAGLKSSTFWNNGWKLERSEKGA